MGQVRAALWVSVWLIAFAAPTSFANDSPDRGPTLFHHWAELSIGEAVAFGQPFNGTCWFDSVGIVVEPPDFGLSRGLALDYDDDCALAVTDKWERPLNETASGMLAADLGIDIKPLYTADGGVVQHCGIGQGTGKANGFAQRYFTYGWGSPGKHDELTRNYDEIRYCYDGSNVAIFSHDGHCGWKSVTGWANDWCGTTSKNTFDSTMAYVETKGQFHWEPPPGPDTS